MSHRGRGISLGVIIFIILIVLVIGWLILNNVYVIQKTSQINTYDYYCDNGTITKVEKEIPYYFYVSPETECSGKCLSSNKGRNYVYCNENNEIICVCEITAYSKHIKPLF